MANNTSKVAWSGQVHVESAVADYGRQEKGRALKSPEKLKQPGYRLVEHRFPQHADSRETMQNSQPGLHVSAFLLACPVPHTFIPVLYQLHHSKVTAMAFHCYARYADAMGVQ